MDHSGQVLVRSDGSVLLTAAELRRVGIGPAAALRLVAAADGAALVSPDVYPRKAYVEITTHCNLDCAMCQRNSWDSSGGAMSADTFGKLLQQLKDLPGATTICLSGYGEPMGHPLFYELVSEAKAAGFVVEVVTNGTLLGPAAAERLVDLRLDKLIVSVDGISAESSRLLHAGSLDRVKSGLRALQQLTLARNEDRPELAIEFVATRRNIHELPTLERRAHVLGVTSILVTNLIPHTPELAEDILYGHWSTTSSTRGTSAWAPCVDLPLMDVGREAAAVQRLARVGTHLRRNGADVAGVSPRCRFITEGRFAIRWDGRVSPCLSLMHSHTYYCRGKPKHIRAYHLGNVNDTPVEAIWNGGEYRDFRDRVRKFEFSPCINCGGCDLRETNEKDCTGDLFPRCGECLWAAGLVQCP